MKSIKIAYHLISKRKVLNGILFVQIILSFYMLLFMIKYFCGKPGLFLVLFILTQIGMICCHLIQLFQNREVFKVYYMIGMTRGRGIMIELIRNGMIAGFSILWFLGISTLTGLLPGTFRVQEYPVVIAGGAAYLFIAFVPATVIFWGFYQKRKK